MSMDLVARLLTESNFLILALVLALYLVFNLEKVVSFYDSSRKLRSTSIATALADPHLTEEMKVHLRDEANLEHFRMVHGVRLSTPRLNAAMVLKERMNGQVQFRHVLNVIKTSPNISNLASHSYRVQLDRSDKYAAWYNLFFGALITLAGIPLTVFAVYTLTTGFNVSLLLIGLFFFATGLYMLRDGVVIVSVRYVNGALVEYEQVHANTNNHSSAATDNSSPDTETATGMA
ncbi:hypothetical protein [Shewanella sedimentimangrovi]|uniref:Uncharacterized protein n=1 Tax=Shewanella sedimentimangrovi TaxID=2814293 RepID=A0ABX7R3F1_9GAMM|nr:hypothetical protein [Shewanella sedimentimangrovi]QSX37618.1 hypothetical protein JYB85_01920 [Shewanella sedimentimangrovi]